jgi:hypothetical protein
MQNSAITECDEDLEETGHLNNPNFYSEKLKINYGGMK